MLLCLSNVGGACEERGPGWCRGGVGCVCVSCVDTMPTECVGAQTLCQIGAATALVISWRQERSVIVTVGWWWWGGRLYLISLTG